MKQSRKNHANGLDVLRRARAELKTWRSRFHDLYERAPVGCLTMNAKGIVLEANPAAAAFLDPAGGSILNKPLLSFILPDDQRSARRLFATLRKTGARQTGEFRVVPPLVCNMTPWVKIETRRTRGEAGAVAYSMFVSDLSLLKRTERTVFESMKRGKLFFRRASDGIVVGTIIRNRQGKPVDFIIDYANAAFVKLSNLSVSDIATKRASKLIEGAGTASLIRVLAKVALTGKAANVDFYFAPWKRRCHLSAHVLVKGRFVMFLKDITEHKRLEDEMIRVSSAERQSLSHELHDGVMQQIAGAAYLLHALKAKLPPDQAVNTKQIDAMLQSSLKQLRHMVHGLRPVGLEDSDLVNALRRLARMTSETFQVHCRLEESGKPADVDLSTSTHLYNLVREAVSNAVRHGKARDIVISLRFKKGRLQTVVVRDNGSGFVLSKVGKDRMGLRIMRYRADLIGAVMTISSRKNGGTRIRCDLPAWRWQAALAGRIQPH